MRRAPGKCAPQRLMAGGYRLAAKVALASHGRRYDDTAVPGQQATGVLFGEEQKVFAMALGEESGFLPVLPHGTFCRKPHTLRQLTSDVVVQPYNFPGFDPRPQTEPASDCEPNYDQHQLDFIGWPFRQGGDGGQYEQNADKTHDQADTQWPPSCFELKCPSLATRKSVLPSGFCRLRRHLPLVHYSPLCDRGQRLS